MADRSSSTTTPESPPSPDLVPPLAPLPARLLVGPWHWLVLVCLGAVAVWQYLAFDGGTDYEYPKVARSTYNPHPPAVYRLAEPGDTLDRAALYAAACGFVASLCGWFFSVRRNRQSALWPVASALFLAAGWHAATPWPTVDHWHGWNWYSLTDPTLPGTVRVSLMATAAALTVWSIAWTLACRPRWSHYLAVARRHGSLPLFALGGLGVAWRMARLPDGEPAGYWSGWAFGMGLIAIGLGLLREVPGWPSHTWKVGVLWAGWVTASIALCVGGRLLIWYHRPLERLHPVVPGAIYISAMPSYRGLEIAHQRHGFRTIINVFNENTPLRSPRLDEELRFVQEHGIRYLAAPADTTRSDEFLDETLRIAQDPSAWPILVHCHGCMDRSPCWMGIYRFVVQGRPLREIVQEIEAHRGVRPKAVVTLLYNRVLARRAPQRFATDPTAQEFLRNARESEDPFVAEYAAPGAEPTVDEPRIYQIGRAATPDQLRP